MRSTTVFASIAGMLLMLAGAGGYQAGQSVFLKNSEVFVGTPGSGEARQVTDDGRPKGLLAQSKDGGRFAFVRESKAELADILVMRSDGAGLREIHFRPVEANVSGMRGVEELEWISDQRLVASGSVNPSTAEYAVIDVETGREVAGYLVDGFGWEASPDGSHAAYVGYIPHFTPEASRRPQFCLDDECTFMKPSRNYQRADVHIEFTSKPVWSSDSSSVAITAENYETKAESVIVRPVGGRPLELAAPPGAEGSLQTSWDGNVLVVRAGSHAWRLEPGASAFVPSR